MKTSNCLFRLALCAFILVSTCLSSSAKGKRITLDASFEKDVDVIYAPKGESYTALPVSETWKFENPNRQLIDGIGGKIISDKWDNAFIERVWYLDYKRKYPFVFGPIDRNQEQAYYFSHKSRSHIRLGNCYIQTPVIPGYKLDKITIGGSTHDRDKPGMVRLCMDKAGTNIIYKVDWSQCMTGVSEKGDRSFLAEIKNPAPVETPYYLCFLRDIILKRITFVYIEI